MNDEDFPDEPGPRSQGRGVGRRAAAAATTRPPIDEDFDSADPPTLDGEDTVPTQQPLRVQATRGGWGDSVSTTVAPGGSSAAIEIDSTKTAFGRRAGTTATPITPTTSVPNKDKYDAVIVDGIQDITEIPDLEEEDAGREGDLSTRIAEAPNVRGVHRVQKLQELEQQIVGQLPSGIDGLDISLLTSVLSPQEKVGEPDAVWEFDVMFSDVSSEMQAESETGEEKEEGEGEEEEEKPTAATGGPGGGAGAGAGAGAVGGTTADRPTSAATATASTASSALAAAAGGPGTTAAGVGKTGLGRRAAAAAVSS